MLVGNIFQPHLELTNANKTIHFISFEKLLVDGQWWWWHTEILN